MGSVLGRDTGVSLYFMTLWHPKRGLYCHCSLNRPGDDLFARN